MGIQLSTSRQDFLTREVPDGVQAATKLSRDAGVALLGNETLQTGPRSRPRAGLPLLRPVDKGILSIADEDASISSSYASSTSQKNISCWQSFVDLINKVLKAVSDFFSMLFCCSSDKKIDRSKLFDPGYTVTIDQAAERLKLLKENFKEAYEEAFKKAQEDGTELTSDNIAKYLFPDLNKDDEGQTVCAKIAEIDRFLGVYEQIEKELNPSPRPIPEWGLQDELEIEEDPLEKQRKEFNSKIFYKNWIIFIGLDFLLYQLIAARHSSGSSSIKIDLVLPDTFEDFLEFTKNTLHPYQDWIASFTRINKENASF